MKTKTTTITAAQPALFETTAVRRVMHAGEWHWSVIDIIQALTGSKRPRKYWADLKIRIEAEGVIELSAKIGQLKMPALDGKSRTTDAADLETCLRIIQSIPSPKAEPFRQWLSRVAVERLKEEADPDLTIRRGVRRYRALGMTDEHIKARLDGILKRNILTEEWKKRHVELDGGKFAYSNLTNGGYRKLFGCDKKTLVDRMGLKPGSNPREAMEAVALQVVSLQETLAVAITRRDNAKGYRGCIKAVHEAGDITRQTADNIEAALGKPLIPVAPPWRTAPASAPKLSKKLKKAS